MRTAGIQITENGDPDARARVIYVGVPSFGMVSVRWHAHMLALQHPMNRPIFYGFGIGFEVGQARNYLVQQALDWTNGDGHTVSHLFFVDDDVLIPPYALSALLGHRRPIVSGLYYAKLPDPNPLILMGGGTGCLRDVPVNTVVDCWAHGMGCTLIEMRVFRDLLASGAVDYETLPSGQRLPQFFRTTKDEPSHDGIRPVRRFETEDVYFLRLALEAGYQPAVDTGVFAFHWDQKAGVGYPLHLWKQYQETGRVVMQPEVVA